MKLGIFVYAIASIATGGIAAVATAIPYASTPQAAAIKAQYFDPNRTPIVRRVNVLGRFAAVLTGGGRIEGDLNSDAILVRRFSFGWQALDLLNERCRLESHGLGAGTDGRLMTGMPSPHDDRPCRGYFKDGGPKRDVESVRRMMRGPFVPYVLVAGSWAMGGWYGAGGGESLFQKRDGRWQLVISGGGAMGVDDVRRYGVPQLTWCKLGIFDARC